eukprot:6117886-Amphidinium_carterae.1
MEMVQTRMQVHVLTKYQSLQQLSPSGHWLALATSNAQDAARHQHEQCALLPDLPRVSLDNQHGLMAFNQHEVLEPCCQIVCKRSVLPHIQAQPAAGIGGKMTSAIQRLGLM